MSVLMITLFVLFIIDTLTVKARSFVEADDERNARMVPPGERPAAERPLSPEEEAELTMWLNDPRVAFFLKNSPYWSKHRRYKEEARLRDLFRR